MATALSSYVTSSNSPTTVPDVSSRRTWRQRPAAARQMSALQYVSKRDPSGSSPETWSRIRRRVLR